MSLLVDWQIIDRCIKEEMITPFTSKSINTSLTPEGWQKILSYGVSSGGYDMVLAKEELKVFSNLNALLVDPRKVNPKSYIEPSLQIDEDGLKYVVLPPNSTMLGHTREYFKIPRDILVTCVGKSTYARVGVSLIVTPLEPGWEGNLVVEIVNHCSSPVKIYPDQGIGQLLFNELSADCTTSYADRGGKYQSQLGTMDACV